MIKPKSNINILLYHQIGDKPNDKTNLDCFCSITEFKSQMNFLKEENFKVISLNEAIDLITDFKTIQKNYVVLTFDDGCESFFRFAFPILESFNYPASIYPITGFLGKVLKINGRRYDNLKILSKNRLIELSKLGVHIGAHSEHHFKLSKIPIFEAETEIKNSKFYLEQLLGVSIDSFSFPHGDYNKEILRLIEQLGFSNSLTCISDFAQNAKTLFEIPRKYVTYFDTIETFKQKLR